MERIHGARRTLRPLQDAWGGSVTLRTPLGALCLALAGVVDLGAPAGGSRRLVFVRSWETDTRHRIEIVVLDRSVRRPVTIDAFVVLRGVAGS